MTETESKPWWKRVWVAVGAFAVGVLAAIVLVALKVNRAKGAVEADQKDKDEVLADRLEDKDALKEAKLDTIEAKQDTAELEAKVRLEDKKDAIDDAARKDADALARNPAALPDALFDSLKRAERKL